MFGSVRSGNVNPDSHPPRPWSHVEVPAKPPPPPRPAVESSWALAAGRVLGAGRWVLGAGRRPAVLSVAPRPPPRPPRPAPAAIPRVACAASGAVLGPRI